MSYQDLPDPRPAGVRLALRRMPRLGAVSVAVVLGLAVLAALAGLLMDPDHPVIWGVTALAALFAAIHYISAIRWSDRHQAWPHRRSRHRHRSRTH
jgi:hypothetical protein